MSSFPALTFDELEQLTGGRLGTHDVLCPRCGPQRRSATNRTRKVLRVWHHEPNFATFCCARCGITGFAFADNRTTLSRDDRTRIARARAEAEEFDRERAAKQLAKAHRLWRSRRPIVGTIAEYYLREERGFSGELPGTLGFLPPRGAHPPALIAAFGIPAEPEPGVLTIADTDVLGIHITRLKPDGSGKDPHEPAKVMIARSLGWPIVLAPPNDGGGLAITEGIEDALTIVSTIGLGVWAAGAASRLPALAERVPAHADCITIFADTDANGLRHARELEQRLRRRRVFVSIAQLPEVAL